MMEKEITKILLETGSIKRHIKIAFLLCITHHIEAIQTWPKFYLILVLIFKHRTSLASECCTLLLRVINQLLFISFIKLRKLTLIQKMQEAVLRFTGHVLDHLNLLWFISWPGLNQRIFVFKISMVIPPFILQSKVQKNWKVADPLELYYFEVLPKKFVILKNNYLLISHKIFKV
jgi:hypothetical protein